jgi:hypothetical protein
LEVHLKHNWAMLGFLTEPTLIGQVNEYEEVGELILASERVVRKIYHGASAVDMDTKLSELSVSLAAFRGKSSTFGRGFIWNDPMLAKGGRAHEWHDIYSYPFHKVLAMSRARCRRSSRAPAAASATGRN